MMEYCFVELRKVDMVNLNYLKNHERKCLLLKMNTDAGIGYTEYTPWAELGQVSCEQMLEQIKQDPDHFLRKKMLADAKNWQALIDKDLPHFSNHSFKMAEHKISICDKSVKIKLSGKRHRDRDQIKSACKVYGNLRLDANYRYEKQEFTGLVADLGELLQKVEYIEDPIPWDEGQYEHLLEQKIPIAVDQPYNVNGAKLKKPCPYIFKPSLGELKAEHKNYIFSSNFGHPLGLWQNYCELIEHGNLELTHGIYCPDLYDSWNSPFNIREGKVHICRSILKRLYGKLTEQQWTRV